MKLGERVQPVFRFVEREVEIGGTKKRFYILPHPGAVGIAAWQDGKLLLIKQPRPATDGSLWEVPAGTLERGEDPAGCAVRELEEETGYRPAHVEPLGRFYVAPGYSSEFLHLYLATDLSRGQTNWDEGELIEEQRWLSLDEVATWIQSGRLVDAKSIAAYTYLTLKGE
ncbi:MAG TPA: NUDIX hydrolase [Limnochordia bacterium]|nr:NUDIX hydrolase [Limnochordia bacterium]